MKHWWCKQSYFIRFMFMLISFAIASYSVVLLIERYPLMINMSDSLSFKIGLLIRADTSERYLKNQWVAFHLSDPSLHKRTDILVKVVTGSSGDKVRHQSDIAYVNEQKRGQIKKQSSQGLPLIPGFSGIIPTDHYFVSTPHPKSFDSRYKEVGLIHAQQILGRVKVLW